ncbi:hypothetical protein JCM19237_6103 [Photobacterium aphoticum]|uniref:Uncharacterized protein n=1 Tax=Photobacterium aphoticum TaxID=754436 RepID=A0A090QJ92_9GAMM|nr:hypothetical protein JCM19237_6103 [Photobacterium aphoticum]
MQELKYLQGYPANLTAQVQNLIKEDKLKKFLLKNTRIVTIFNQKSAL